MNKHVQRNVMLPELLTPLLQIDYVGSRTKLGHSNLTYLPAPLLFFSLSGYSMALLNEFACMCQHFSEQDAVTSMYSFVHHTQ